MLIFYSLLAILILSGLKYCKRGFNDEYLSYGMTNAVKGIFILLVFIKHATPYVINAGWSPAGISVELFDLVNNNVGQWIVAMFLFYSGYGVMESIRRKGHDYIQGLPRKRLLQVLVNFDIAVLIFIIAGLILKKPLTFKQCLLSLTGWESVGNSNWYIFIIMLMYLITFIAFCKERDGKYGRPLLAVAVLTFIFSIIMSYFKPEYWFNTMFCYTAGLCFSVYKDKIEKYTKSHYWQILIAVVISLLVIDRIPYHLKGLVYNAFSVIFCCMVVLLTMKFKISSPVLLWCGSNLFPLYIYQRIPMIVFSSINEGAFAAGYPFLFMVACLIVTILIARAYKYISIKF